MKAETILHLTHDDVNKNIPYAFITETRESSVWDTMRRKRLWKELTSAKQDQYRRLFAMARDWYLVKGVPEEVTLKLKDYLAFSELADFCSGVQR